MCVQFRESQSTPRYDCITIFCDTSYITRLSTVIHHNSRLTEEEKNAPKKAKSRNYVCIHCIGVSVSSTRKHTDCNLSMSTSNKTNWWGKPVRTPECSVKIAIFGSNFTDLTAWLYALMQQHWYPFDASWHVEHVWWLRKVIRQLTCLYFRLHDTVNLKVELKFEYLFLFVYGNIIKPQQLYMVFNFDMLSLFVLTWESHIGYDHRYKSLF